jgi:hypothetical protein
MEGACAAHDRAAAAGVRTLLEAAQAVRELAGRLAVQAGSDLPAGEPLDIGGSTARLASVPVGPPLIPLALPGEDVRDLAGDFLGGLRDEVTGTVDGLVQGALHPVDAARGLLGMLENPGEALRVMVDWEDLESGHPGRWAGDMLPGMLVGAFTDGAGFLIRAARLLHRFSLEAEALAATLRTLSPEIGDLEARFLVTQLGRETVDGLLRVMTPSETRRIVDELGVTRVRELAERYGAVSMKYYGVEFFKLYQGVTDGLMKHVVAGERMKYRLYRRSPNVGIEQPPSLNPKVYGKTVVRKLDPQRWRRLANEAADTAIKDRTFPKEGDDVIHAMARTARTSSCTVTGR